MFKDGAYNEVVLIQGLKNSDHACFEKLFDLYSAQLYNFSLKLLKSKDAAEDVVQDTFIKIWDRRAQVKTSGSFKSLLMTIALNSIRQSFNQISKENDFKDDLLISLTQDSNKYSSEDAYEELVKKLEDLIAEMPEKRKKVFCKTKIEGAKAKDVADELNLSIKTVEYHVAEAMKFLKSEFHNLGISETILLFLLSIPRE